MVLPLSGDAILILIGLAAYLGTCIVSRHPLTWAWALLPGVALAVLLEGWEIWDFHGPAALGEFGPAGIANLAVRHSRDILIMNLAPVTVFLAAHGLRRIAPGGP